MTLLTLSDVAVAFGATTLFEGVTLTVERGDRWGVVGRNGTGKTTLFRIIAGEDSPTGGSVSRAGGAALRVSLMDQHRDFGSAATVWEAAAGPFADLLALEASLAEQAVALGEDAGPEAMDRYARDLERFERDGGYTIAPRVDTILHGLGFEPGEARTRPVEALSGGERGRLALARQLVAPADLLLLDEPTNHLDLETTRWFEQHLAGLEATVMVISHDRAFLAAVADHVLHFEAGTATAYAGDYAAFVRQRSERRLAASRAFAQQRKVIAAEEDYIQRNIAGGNSRQAKGRRRRLARTPRLSAPPEEAGAMGIRLPPGERGGDQVLAAEGLAVEGGGRTLVSGFSATLRRGDVVGLVGPNGAGKSTLLRALLGEHPPSAGRARLGESVRAAWYRQDLSQVPMGTTVYDVIAGIRPAWGRGAIQGHLGAFDFPGDTVQRRTDVLSGGERARLALAMLVLSGANLLVFDEPTNHLDVESIEALEDAVEDFDGTVLLVSHDRALLETLVTRVWVLHEGRIIDYGGTFLEWEQASREREHAAAVAAAEEEASRRVRERRRTRSAEEGRRQTQVDRRSARAAVAEAEARVASAEQRLEGLRARLEDPALYTTSAGAKEASMLGAELEHARRDLEAAFAEWERAVAELEGLAAT